VNSHVFLNEGCRLMAFYPATVDGAHAVCYEECSRTFGRYFSSIWLSWSKFFVHCQMKFGRIVSRSRRTLRDRGEGHSAAGWGIHAGGSKVRSFGKWVTANCAAPPTASTGQYATSNCKPLLFGFPCKWRYINVGIYICSSIRRPPASPPSACDASACCMRYSF